MDNLLRWDLNPTNVVAIHNINSDFLKRVYISTSNVGTCIILEKISLSLIKKKNNNKTNKNIAKGWSTFKDKKLTQIGETVKVH